MDKSLLASALRVLGPVAKSNSPAPKMHVSNHHGDYVVLSADDGQRSVTVFVPGQIRPFHEGKPVTPFLLAPSSLQKMIDALLPKSAKGLDLQLAESAIPVSGDKNVLDEAGELTVGAGSRRVVLTTQTAAVYPPAAVWGALVAESVIPAGVLADALNYLLPVATNDETRYNLTRIQFRADGTAFSSDGYRAHKTATPPLNPRSDELVSKYAAATLLDAITAFAPGVVRCTVHENVYGFSFTGRAGVSVFVSDMRDESIQFPDALQAFPATNERVCRIDAAALRESLVIAQKLEPVSGRVVISAGPNGGHVLSISSSGALGSFRDEIPAEWVRPCARVGRSGVNLEFLLQTLLHFGHDMLLGFDGDMEPIVLRHAADPRIAAVVMPMKL